MSARSNLTQSGIYGKTARSNVSGQAYLLSMKIDCDTCVMKDRACSECVMTVLLQISVPQSEISENQVQAISVLAENGLVPPLRFSQSG